MKPQANADREAMVAEYATTNLASEPEFFYSSVCARVLRAFDSIKSEALDSARAGFRIEIQELEAEGQCDSARQLTQTVADGIEELLLTTRQGTVNLLTAGICHLFEQSRGGYSDFTKQLGVTPVPLDSLSEWPDIEELCLVANVSKHGAGRSERELRRRRPDLFVSTVEVQVDDCSTGAELAPLTGRGLSVGDDELRKYAEAVASLWRSVARVHQARCGT